MSVPDRWLIAPKAPEAYLRSVARFAPPQLGQILWNRGFRDVESVEAFLRGGDLSHLPDPFTYEDMGKAIARLARAKKRRERVFIHGDCDPDGACGAAILRELCAALGIEAKVYLPDRVSEGHGISDCAVEEIIRSRAKLLLTVDTGVSEHRAIATLRSRGIDTIVLDHHLVPETLPDAVAVIDAQRPDDRYPFDWLCGTAVAFVFAQAVTQHPLGRSLPSTILTRWLDLVAIATVADLVPLEGLNRLLLRLGISALRETERVGLRMLYRVARLAPRTIDEETIAFDIAPRLNAASRMDHSDVAYALLTTKEKEEAEKLARDLDRQNRARQRAVAALLREAEDMLAAMPRVPEAIVLWGEKRFSESLLSLVASKLIERYARSVFLCAIVGENARCSGRSVEGIDLIKAMRACGGEELFSRFGGHAMAAGCTIKAEWLPLFRERLQRYAEEHRPAISPAILTADLVIRPHEVSPELLAWFDELGPFGKGNPRPLVAMRNLIVLGVRKGGRGARRTIVRVAEAHGGRVIEAFLEDHEEIPPLRGGDEVDLMGEIVGRRWGRGHGVEIRIRGMRRKG
jgi:single-stranded-DNA-specific exonuclease